MAGIGAGLVFLAVISPFVGFLAARWYFEPDLPPVAALADLQLQVPLHVYTRDGKLIGEFGAERRTPLAYDEIPPRIIQAFLAAEDDRFFEHPGVDWQGLARATLKLAATGEKSQGGSTITMQLARNIFLSSERTYARKIKEILLAMRIEREFTKQQILEIYLNKIFLGQRAYGVGAASKIYFGLEPKDLSWGQASLLAGLPKAPSRDNPVSSRERAKERRDYVLRRLHQLGKVSELEYTTALAEPISVRLAPPNVEADAYYAAEMVRAELYAKYGDRLYTEGLRVTTTIDSKRQDSANRALRNAVTSYDERHGWRGAEARLPPELLTAKPEQRLQIDAMLDERPPAAGLEPVVVVSFAPAKLTVLRRGQQLTELAADDFAWAKLSAKNPLQAGDIIRVRRVGERWRIAQLPQAQGALVALDPRNGTIEAVVGGYDFLTNKYNRVTQAQRQPGSGFKPFLYAAAFNAGFTPASVMLDAPVVFGDELLEGTWRPENYDGEFQGPMRLREALVQSRNLVSVRLLQEIGVDYARDYISKFGLPKERMPRDLSMSLGSASVTPLEMARAYAVLANGGFLVAPYLVESIRDAGGKEIFRATPRVAGNPLAPPPADPAAPPDPALAPQVADPRVVWLVDDILREVTIRGTAAKARELGRSDIAGKTGTTNDETDAWFDGFNGELVAITWMGFDQPTPLGRGEVGGKAALPMWMDFMREALKERKEIPRPRPPGLMSVRVNRSTGLLAPVGDSEGIMETVQSDHVPETAETAGVSRQVGIEELF
jgi:penicillin-binding protein 1A